MTIKGPSLNQDAASRRKSAVRSGHLPGSPLPAKLLEDPDHRVRDAALGARARTHNLTAPDIARAIGDSSPVVRRRVAEILASFASEVVADPGAKTVAEPGANVDANDGLVKLLTDPDDSVVELAAWAAGERSDTSPELLALLCTTAEAHKDALCREAAIAALGAIGDPTGLPAILAGTTATPALRRRAVIALAPFEGPEVQAALTRALGDRDWQVRQAAEDLLGPEDLDAAVDPPN